MSKTEDDEKIRKQTLRKLLEDQAAPVFLLFPSP